MKMIGRKDIMITDDTSDNNSKSINIDKLRAFMDKFPKLKNTSITSSLLSRGMYYEFLSDKESKND
jgi:hypothetical protein